MGGNKMKNNDCQSSLIKCQAVSKSYGDVQALCEVSFQVEEGELYGLIGPDGAGKTTLFRILTTLMLPDSGSAEVAGLDSISDYRDIRNRIGYMPGKFSLYQDLSVEENLNFFATLFGTSLHENYDLIRDIYVQIEPFKTRRAGNLSGGMKQKLALCCALIHRPSVLFLDEPTTGVDAVSRREFWGMLKNLKREGITILVSTPYMDEATLCDRIALIQSGKILSIDTPRRIIDKYAGTLYAVKAENVGRWARDIRKKKDIKSCFAFGESLHVSFTQSTGTAPYHLRDWLLAKGCENVEVKPITPDIEDCFIQLMEDGG
jgi:ABC-type multidrug transport system ATPase subunit